MYKLTNKNYNNLPEVKKKNEKLLKEEKRKQENLARKEKIKELDRVFINFLLNNLKKFIKEIKNKNGKN